MAPNCEEALGNAERDIAGILKTNVQSALTKFMQRRRDDTVIIVTGYGRFWTQPDNPDDDLGWEGPCNNDPEANWAYWSGSKTIMTTQLRRRMNRMVNDANQEIQAAVDEMCGSTPRGTCKLHFVDYNDKWNTVRYGRFCDLDVIEPQKEGFDRPDLLIAQLATKYGQLQTSDNGFVEAPGEYVELMERLKEAVNSSPSMEPNPGYGPFDFASFNAAIAASSLPIPRSWLRVFHPTQNGHELMAQAVYEALVNLGVITPNQLAPTSPTPSNQLACQQAELPENIQIGIPTLGGRIPLVNDADPVLGFTLALRGYFEPNLLEDVKSTVVSGCGIIEQNWTLTDDASFTFKSNGATASQMLRFTIARKDNSDNVIQCVQQQLANALGVGGQLTCPPELTEFSL